jgi:hypothetical protein
VREGADGGRVVRRQSSRYVQSEFAGYLLLKLFVLSVTYVTHVVHAEGFEAGEHAESGFTRFAD